jgi:hypothetical protein
MGVDVVFLEPGILAVTTEGVTTSREQIKGMRMWRTIRGGRSYRVDSDGIEFVQNVL